MKRAIKFLRRDSVDMVKINEMLEIDRQNDSSDESDHDSNCDSRHVIDQLKITFKLAF